MEIRLPVSDLKTALPGFNKIMIRHAPRPVLQHLRVRRSAEGIVDLQATSFDTFATFTVGEQPDEPVDILVPFDVVSKTVKGCSPTDSLVIATVGNRTVLRYLLAGRPVDQPFEPGNLDDWPSVPAVPERHAILDEHLKAAVAQAFDCCSPESTREALMGAWLDVSDPDAHYVMGTDGRHLFSANSFRLGLPATVMIPHHRFLEWNVFRQDGPWQLNVPPEEGTPTGEWLQLKSNRWSFLIRSARHEVPKWRLVLPRNKSTTVIFGAKAVEFLLEALPQLPGKDEAHQPVAFQVAANRLSISGYDPRTDHRTTFPVDDVVVEGREILISVNREFAVKALRWGLNQLVFDDALSPMIFSNAGRRLVAMPVRTEGPAVAPAQDEPVTTELAPTTASPEPDAGTEPEPQPNPEPEPMTKNRIPPTTQTLEAEPPEPTTMPVSRVPAIQTVEQPASKPSIRAVLDQIDVLRDSLRSTVRQFGDVVETLRQIDKERRTSDREVEVIREKLRALQGVRF